MRIAVFLLAVCLCVAGSASAWEGPKVEYSADSYLETADGVMQGKLYSAPGKERREYVEAGETMVIILRHDKKVAWMLMPEDKSYMEIKVPKEGRKDDISGYKIEQTTIGPETVNGVKTTKSKIIMTGPKGEKLDGFWWASKEGIIVKLDAIAVDKKSKERFKTELKNLNVGKQNPAVFEIPAGYSKMDMGGFGGMMGGDDKDDGSKPKDKKKDSGGGFGFKDALDLIK